MGCRRWALKATPRSRALPTRATGPCEPPPQKHLGGQPRQPWAGWGGGPGTKAQLMSKVWVRAPSTQRKREPGLAGHHLLPSIHSREEN